MNDLSRRRFISLTTQGVIVSALLPSVLQAASINLRTNATVAK